MTEKMSHAAKAQAAWGPDMPEWVELLARAADRLGQRAAGKTMGRSGAVVSRVVNNNYGAGTREVEQLVKAAFGTRPVNCPEFGEIPQSSCLRNRRRTGVPVHFMQRRFAEACPPCPLNPDRDAKS